MRQVSLDIETSGLDPRGNSRIVELGAVEFIDGQPTGRQLHYYFNPGSKLAPGVPQIIKLSDEFLAQQPSFAEHAMEISEFLSGAELVLFYGKFDISFLGTEFMMAGLHAPDFARHIDIHEIANSLFSEKRRSLSCLSGLLGLAPPSGNTIDIANLIMAQYKRLDGNRPMCSSDDMRPFAPLVPIFRDDSVKLNPGFTFANFVPGKANEFSCAMALKVAVNQEEPFSNPLVIVGETGFGKTHLLHAIGNKMRGDNPNARIRYVHAMAFVDSVVQAYKHKAFDEFKQAFDSLDLLLLEDLHHLSGKARSQEELLRIFDFMSEHGKRIVITSTCPIKEIDINNPQLAGRLESGMTVHLLQADLTSKMAILHTKGVENNISLDDDVTQYIAERVSSNIREMEGVLRRIVAHSLFFNTPVSIDLAKEMMK